MKNKTLFVSVLLFCFATAYTQTEDNKKNIVKTNLPAYAFRNYNLTYERSLLRWLSIGVSYGKMPEGSIPFTEQVFSESDPGEIDLTKAEMSSSQITIEPRLYLGKGICHGFYVAPYFRQTKIEMENIIYIMSFETEDTPLAVSGKTDGTGFGLMLGSQWFVGKKNNWVIDWWIVGGHWGSGKGNLDAKSDRLLTTDEQIELEEEFADLDDVEGVEYTITTNDYGLKMDYTSPWAGLRVGLSLGYRF